MAHSVKLKAKKMTIILLHKTTLPISQKSCTILSVVYRGGRYISISQKKRIFRIIACLKNTRPHFSVYSDIMNAILSICSEYSENVWYSGFGLDSIPTRIAIEIDRKYRFHFLKLMAKHGFMLASMKKGDEESCILTLEKQLNKILI